MITEDFDTDKARDLARTAFAPFMQWERLRNPQVGYTRLALALAFPFVIWSHSWLLIALYAVAVIIHPMWFPPYISADEDEPFMTQIADAVHGWVLQSSREDKILVFFPGLALFIPLIGALWAHLFFWSLYLFVVLAAYKLLCLYRVLPAIADPFNEDDEDIHHA